MYVVFFSCHCNHRDLHVLTHAFPTRRSSDLYLGSCGRSPVVGLDTSVRVVASVAGLLHRVVVVRQPDDANGGTGHEVYSRAAAVLVPLRDEGDCGALCNAGHHTPPGSPILVARRTRALAASVRLVQTRVVRMNPVRTPPPTRSGLVTNGKIGRAHV